MDYNSVAVTIIFVQAFVICFLAGGSLLTAMYRGRAIDALLMRVKRLEAEIAAIKAGPTTSFDTMTFARYPKD